MISSNAQNPVSCLCPAQIYLWWKEERKKKREKDLQISPKTYHSYHSSHPSFLPLTLSSFFLTTAVPIALGLLTLFSSSAGAPNESQKSLRSGSTVLDGPPLGLELVEPPTPSSMNRFSCSAAPLVPLVMFCATDAAVSRACVGRSAEAI